MQTPSSQTNEEIFFKNGLELCTEKLAYPYVVMSLLISRGLVNNKWWKSLKNHLKVIAMFQIGGMRAAAITAAGDVTGLYHWEQWRGAYKQLIKVS